MNLSKTSEILISYFIENNCIKHDTQTKKTDTILLKLYDDIMEANLFLQKNKPLKRDKILNLQIKKINSKGQIPKPNIFNYNSFPKIIMEHIEQNSTYVVTYSFSLFERKIKLIFIVEDSNVEANIQIYNNYVDYILLWLYIINKYSSKKCSVNFTSYFYFSSLEKKLPDRSGVILEQTHVNTAYTTTCPIDSEIVIFRREEWFKVFIHETFHNFALDFSDMNNTECHKHILSLFPVNSEVNLYESYTEFWAEIMNAVFCSFFSLKDKNNEEEFLTNTEFFLNFERTFSFFQMVKTLDFLGLEYKDLYHNTKKSINLRNTRYNEKTSVLAYYIIKTILIDNYQQFLMWCHRNNFSLLQFKKTVSNQTDFCRFIENKYNSKGFLDSVKCTEEFLDKKINGKNNSNLNPTFSFLSKTMRMTVCELG
jgi:hypothetical protein